MNIGKIKAKLLKTIVSSARALREEVAFDFDENGLLVNCMDESHSCMVSISLEPEGFTSFEVENPYRIGVELGKLTNGISVMGDDEDVEMKIDGKGKFVLSSKTATLSCYKVDTATMEEPQMPNLPLDEYCNVEVDSGELQKAIKALAKVGDAALLRFSYHMGTLEIKAKSDYEELTMRPPINQEKLSDKAAESTYDTEFLVGLMKAMIEGKVSLSFMDEKPIILQETFADGHGDVAVFVAPRIGEDTH